MAQTNQLQKYNGKPSKKEVKWLNHSSIQLDRLLLNNLKRKHGLKKLNLFRKNYLMKLLIKLFLPKEF